MKMLKQGAQLRKQTPRQLVHTKPQREQRLGLCLPSTRPDGKQESSLNRALHRLDTTTVHAGIGYRLSIDHTNILAQKAR